MVSLAYPLSAPIGSLLRSVHNILSRSLSFNSKIIGSVHSALYTYPFIVLSRFTRVCPLTCSCNVSTKTFCIRFFGCIFCGCLGCCLGFCGFGCCAESLPSESLSSESLPSDPLPSDPLPPASLPSPLPPPVSKSLSSSSPDKDPSLSLPSSACLQRQLPLAPFLSAQFPQGHSIFHRPKALVLSRVHFATIVLFLSTVPSLRCTPSRRFSSPRSRPPLRPRLHAPL